MITGFIPISAVSLSKKKKKEHTQTCSLHFYFPSLLSIIYSTANFFSLESKQSRLRVQIANHPNLSSCQKSSLDPSSSSSSL